MVGSDAPAEGCQAMRNFTIEPAFLYRSSSSRKSLTSVCGFLNWSTVGAVNARLPSNSHSSLCTSIPLRPSFRCAIGRILAHDIDSGVWIALCILCWRMEKLTSLWQAGSFPAQFQLWAVYDVLNHAVKVVHKRRPARTEFRVLARAAALCQQVRSCKA